MHHLWRNLTPNLLWMLLVEVVVAHLAWIEVVKAAVSSLIVVVGISYVKGEVIIMHWLHPVHLLLCRVGLLLLVLLVLLQMAELDVRIVAAIIVEGSKVTLMVDVVCLRLRLHHAWGCITANAWIRVGIGVATMTRVTVRLHERWCSREKLLLIRLGVHYVLCRLSNHLMTTLVIQHIFAYWGLILAHHLRAHMARLLCLRIVVWICALIVHWRVVGLSAISNLNLKERLKS